MNLPDTPPTVSLSRKDLLVLKSIASGKTSQQIADEMFLSLPTVKWYRKKLKNKFEAATTVEMVRKAVEWKIV